MHTFTHSHTRIHRFLTKSSGVGVVGKALTKIKIAAAVAVTKNENRSTKSQYLKPDSFAFYLFFLLSVALFRFACLPLIMFVCVLKNIFLSGSLIKATSHQFSFDFSYTVVWYAWAWACVCFGKRSILLQNQSQRFALSMCVCECSALIKFLSHIFDTHLYSSGIFRVVYFIEHHFQHRHRGSESEKKEQNLSQNVSFCYSSRSMLLVPLSLLFLDFQIEYSCLHLRSHPENVRFVAFVFIFWWFFFAFFDASIHHLHLACISPIFNMLSYPFSCKPVEQRWGQHGRRMCCLGLVCINDNIRAYV